ncbi:helix-turn-helix domain-containing protein [Cohnella sp. REN36]|uniref:helix-turn-helix domain-containing protein n=1 Tax=Cohnella sp. REN36 TaxID=2887347 RepID=UPI001D13FF24|nr:helix-turn-helix domain-containing protein [Cohnella sp. REN36]MCC3374472.1 response regulator [Cohnella sp. REN36]
MYRVLLVDDEAHSVRGLQAGVHWERLHIEEVYTAHSLRQAQDVFESHPIDLMVCDIEMPQGSGLELLAWVRERYPRTETVFLTCHSDFSYAKQAIKLDSFDYLLKPVDYEELESVLSKASDKIGKDRERRAFEETHRKYADLWESHRPLRKERFWKDVVEQALPSNPEKIEESAKERNLAYTANMTFLPVYVRVKRWTKELSQREQRIMEYALRNAAEEKLADNDPEAAAVSTGNGALLVLVPSSPNEGPASGMKARCKEYIETSGKYFYCDLCCYIGRRSAPHEMAAMLGELQKADADNVTGYDRMFVLNEVPRIKLPFDPPPLREWGEWLKAGTRDRLAADIERYLSRFEEGRAELDAARLHRIYHDFLQMVHYVLQLKGLQANEVFSENLLTDRPEAVLQSVRAFREWALYVVEVAVNRLFATEDNVPIVERVKRFIRQQIGELELSREEIARHVYLNPDYLTRLFKKETGLSISDYLQQQRIEFAKGLLERTEKSISDVAVASGYSNLSYFSTIFKKSVGMTPADYRKSRCCK